MFYKFFNALALSAVVLLGTTASAYAADDPAGVFDGDPYSTHSYYNGSMGMFTTMDAWNGSGVLAPADGGIPTGLPAKIFDIGGGFVILQLNNWVDDHTTKDIVIEIELLGTASLTGISLVNASDPTGLVTSTSYFDIASVFHMTLQPNPDWEILQFEGIALTDIGSLNISTRSYTPEEPIVPEPGTVAALGAGLAAGIRRIRRKHAA